MRFRNDNKRPDPVAQTQYGTLRGRSLRSRGADGHPRDVNLFLGVPYARPPIGELRFCKPVAPDAWTGVRDARRYARRAVQKRFPWDCVESRVSTSEDCLYLNVIAPEKPATDSRGHPIMVYIHGGGYVMDCAAKYHYKGIARNLVSRDVVVVTVEYRLGVLGFLCLDDKNAKGNFGIWDQIAALRFVRDNAAAFGGDPERITLFGQSAGGASVDFLSMSPVSRDLFQQSIIMAGFAESSWAMAERSLVVKFCRDHALRLGFRRHSDGESFGDIVRISASDWTEEENRDCVEFLRRIPSTEFEMSLVGESFILNRMRLSVTPVRDDELFPRPIAELRRDAVAKPSIVGITEHEGLLFLALGRRRANRRLLDLGESRIGDLLAEAAHRRPDRHWPTVVDLKAIYSSDERTRKDATRAKRVCVDMLSDLINGAAMSEHSRRRAVATDVAERPCYRFVFAQTNRTLTTIFNFFFPFIGATHGIELAYLFDVNIFVSPWLKTKADRRVADRFSHLLTNFAKFGDPNGAAKKPADEIIDPKFGEKQFVEKPESIWWSPVDAAHPQRHLVIADRMEMRDASTDTRRAAQMVPVLDAIRSVLSAE